MCSHRPLHIKMASSPEQEGQRWLRRGLKVTGVGPTPTHTRPGTWGGWLRGPTRLVAETSQRPAPQPQPDLLRPRHPEALSRPSSPGPSRSPSAPTSGPLRPAEPVRGSLGLYTQWLRPGSHPTPLPQVPQPLRGRRHRLRLRSKLQAPLQRTTWPAVAHAHP